MSRADGYAPLATDETLGNNSFANSEGEPSGYMRAALPLPSQLKINGARVYLHWSALILCVFFGYFMWMAARTYPSTTLAWLIPVSVLFLVSSIFLHECAHALAWKIYNVKAHYIILYGMGGLCVAQPPAGLPKSASVVVPLSGPLVNLALSGLILPWYYAGMTPRGISSWISFFWGYTQLFLGVFNLLPGAPLDGIAIVKGLLTFCLDAYKSLMVSHIGGAIVVVIVGILAAIYLSYFSALYLGVIAAFTAYIAYQAYSSRPRSLTNPQY